MKKDIMIMRDFPIIEKAAFNLAVWSLAGDILSFYILQDKFLTSDLAERNELSRRNHQQSQHIS